uniref:Peptidase C1A papain C-terminal domain-containing protein n=1 Tax=Oncorhynchus mykiss TaxID=8022 RepID=A0A8C7LGD1_ONCMY
MFPDYLLLINLFYLRGIVVSSVFYNKECDMEEYYHRLQIFIENKRVDHDCEGNHKFTSMNNCITVVFLQLLEVCISFEYVNILIEGTCKFKTDLAAAFAKDVVNITRYDEMGMLDAVAKHNPVSLAYEVTSDFMHYHSGVYSTPEDGIPKKVSWGRPILFLRSIILRNTFETELIQGQGPVERRLG